MSRPYRTFRDGDVIRAQDWNDIQTTIKEEVRTHRHGGGRDGETDPAKLGGKLRGNSLEDRSVTHEKLAENGVTARVLAPGSVKTTHFVAKPAIQESKIAFDPDEPAAHAIARVLLSAPQDEVDLDKEFSWPIPVGTPVTNDIGDVVFRTMDPVVLNNEQPEIEVTARCDEIGEGFNLEEGELTRIGGALDPFLRAHIEVANADDKPSTGGIDADVDQPPQPAVAQVEFDILEDAPPSFWVVPKGTKFKHDPGDGERVYATQEALNILPATRAGAVTAVPVDDPGWDEETNIDPKIEPRLDKLSDPVLRRYLKLGTVKEPIDADAVTVMVTFTVEPDAPFSAWSILKGARLTQSTDDSDGGNVPVFETRDDLILFPRSGWVRAHSTNGGTRLSKQSLDRIGDESLKDFLEVDQPEEASADGKVLLRFRVVDAARAQPWTIPARTQVSSSTVLDVEFETQEEITLEFGASGPVELRSSAFQGQDAEIVMPDTKVRIGNIVDRTFAQYMTVETRENRAWLTIDDRAPQSVWLIPKGTDLARGNGDPPNFETREALAIWPRTGWVWAEPETDSVESDAALPAATLTEIDGNLSGVVEITQPEASHIRDVRVWFRVFDSQPGTEWTIPEETKVSNRDRSVIYKTKSALVINQGGKGIVAAESAILGEAGNDITDITLLASDKQFERQVQVRQPDQAKGGADGGSQGHHHKDEEGAPRASDLAVDSVGPEQVREGAVTWAKLEAGLATSLRAMRDQLKLIEDALADADALEALQNQRHGR